LASSNSGVRGRRGRRKSVSESITLLFVGALVLLAALMTGGGVYDQIHREAVRPQMVRSWAHARQVLVRRLNQQDPLELGAVWATHKGMICGLVNGRHSFSGLAGMTPFAVDGDQAVFALDQTGLAFAPYWRECATDQWIVLVQGSMQAGGCATKLGQARCVTVQ